MMIVYSVALTMVAVIRVYSYTVIFLYDVIICDMLYYKNDNYKC
jgi:hypothetical protein